MKLQSVFVFHSTRLAKLPEIEVCSIFSHPFTRAKLAETEWQRPAVQEFVAQQRPEYRRAVG